MHPINLERNQVTEGVDGWYGQKIQGSWVEEQVEKSQNWIAKTNLTQQDHHERLYQSVMILLIQGHLCEFLKEVPIHNKTPVSSLKAVQSTSSNWTSQNAKKGEDNLKKIKPTKAMSQTKAWPSHCWQTLTLTWTLKLKEKSYNRKMSSWKKWNNPQCE